MIRPLQNLMAAGAASLAAFAVLFAATALAQLVLPALVFFNMLQFGAALLVALGNASPSGIASVISALLLAGFVIGGITLVVSRRRMADAPAPDLFARTGRRTGIGCGIGVSLPFLLYVARGGTTGLILAVIGTAYWVIACGAAGQVAGLALREVLRRMDPDMGFK
jgi:hypothetical protein